MDSTVSLRKASLQTVAFFAALMSVVAGTEKKCSVEPKPIQLSTVEVPVTWPVDLNLDRTVQSPYERSILIRLGGQSGTDNELAVGFSTGHNVTFVPDIPSLCSSTVKEYPGCVFWRGGNYSKDTSVDFRADDGTVSNNNGTASNAGYDQLNSHSYKERKIDPLAQFQRGWDTVEFFTGPRKSMTIHGYPLSIVTNSSFPFSTGGIGIASDSTFLKTMIETENAPSKSFGLYTGRNKEDPGELIIGGYNEDRVHYTNFKNFTVNADPTIPCPLQVRVEGIQFGGATQSGAFSYSEEFDACIDPGQHTNIVPQGFLRAWTALIERGQVGPQDWRHNATAWDSINFKKPSETEDWNSYAMMDQPVNIRLKGGFTARVPFGSFIEKRGAATVNDEHGKWHWNSSFGTTHFGNGGFDDSDPLYNVLGRPLLSALYLAVDYENMVFSLGDCFSNESCKSTETPKLRKLGCDDYASQDTGQGDGERGSSQQEDAAEGASSSNKGKLIGGVVGGVVGALLVIGALIFFYLRRRKSNGNNPIPVEQHDSDLPKIAEAPGSPPQYPYPASGTMSPGLYEADSTVSPTSTLAWGYNSPLSASTYKSQSEGVENGDWRISELDGGGTRGAVEMGNEDVGIRSR